MKWNVFTLILFCSCYALHAQNHVASITPSEFQRHFVTITDEFLQTEGTRFIYDEKKYRNFKKMRTLGMVLTGVGSGLITTGVVMISSERNFFESGIGGWRYICR